MARWRSAGSQQPVSPSQVSSTAVSGSHLTDSFCFLFSCPRGRSMVISSYKQYPHFFAPPCIPFPCKTEGEKTSQREQEEKKKTNKQQFAKQNVALGPINLDRNPRCWSCSWDWTRALTINRRGSGSLLVFFWLVGWLKKNNCSASRKLCENYNELAVNLIILGFFMSQEGRVKFCTIIQNMYASTHLCLWIHILGSTSLEM